MSSPGRNATRIVTAAGLVASIVLSWPVCAAAGRASDQGERENGMEFQKGYAPVDGLRIYYEIHGIANSAYPPLVLLHGGGDTIQTSFGHLLPELARSRQVIAFEQQGFGHSADIADRPFSFERSADDTAALLQYLHVEQADVFGFSNGSTIALQVAIRHPRLVRKLVVASGFFSHVGADPAFWNGFEHAQLQQMPQELRDSYLAVAPHPENLQMFFDKCVRRMRDFKGGRGVPTDPAFSSRGSARHRSHDTHVPLSVACAHDQRLSRCPYATIPMMAMMGLSSGWIDGKQGAMRLLCPRMQTSRHTPPTPTG